ncbi:MAG: MBL fold metallo-hydrolase [Clostridiales bacterium]|jgi:ribonuclease BN (tRNA processing enzyme)|nr:MBL fold metallo-hydrolase [Clostridiales bacterium]
MRIKVLCKYGKYPTPNGGTSSFLLEGKDAAVILDTGSGAAAAIAGQVALNKIDAIILSHLHYDHMCDILPLVYKCACDKTLRKKLTVYLPETPADVFAVIRNTGAYDLRIIKDGMTVQINSLKLTFFAMTHPVETYAVRAEEDGKVVAYTADTTENGNIKKLISGCSYVLADACVLEKDAAGAPHISVKKIARLTSESRSKIILIHLPPEGGHGEILREATSENECSYLADTEVYYEI